MVKTVLQLAFWVAFMVMVYVVAGEDGGVLTKAGTTALKGVS
jgi:hypothetical protein